MWKPLDRDPKTSRPQNGKLLLHFISFKLCVSWSNIQEGKDNNGTTTDRVACQAYLSSSPALRYKLPHHWKRNNHGFNSIQFNLTKLQQKRGNMYRLFKLLCTRICGGKGLHPKVENDDAISRLHLWAWLGNQGYNLPILQLPSHTCSCGRCRRLHLLHSQPR